MLIAPVLALLAATAAPDLRTHAAKTAYAETGRYEEVERLCPAFERAFPHHARCFRFGTTPERRPMLAIAASADGILTPQAARAAHRPVVLFQGGIHAGEIDGKDGGFEALEAALRAGARGPLSRVTAVFVPVFNVDGHERFGPNHRPNQVGPREAGWRTNAGNLNLNRDYARADAPEMRAMLALLGAWDPVVYVDLHTTDGAKFQHDVAVMTEPRRSGPAALQEAARSLSNALVARLAAAGHLPLDFYPSFVTYDDPATGFDAGVVPARLADGYWPLRNRLGILVETHSWRTNAERVRSSRDAVDAVLALSAERGADWLRVARDADAETRALAGKPVALSYELTAATKTIRFLGYAYRREPSAISGRLMTTYDDSRPQVWEVPLRDEVRPALAVTAPRGGYVVAAGYAAEVAPRLAAHGIAFTRISAARAAHPVEAFRATDVRFGAAPVEGRQSAHVTGAWQREAQDLAAGSLFVPIDQPEAPLAMQLLEPRAPDSFTSSGLFNAAFEKREYMEPYVAEAVARELLSDPAIRAEFDRLLATDPAFAADGDARLEFFHRHHPSWDARFRLVPVFRVDAAP